MNESAIGKCGAQKNLVDCSWPVCWTESWPKSTLLTNY